MKMLKLLYLLPLLLFFAFPCEKTGLRTKPDSGSKDASGEDAGPQVVLETFSYTPDGCSHTVSTPESISPARGGEIFGDSPTPNHVHVGWSADTATSFNVVWETDVETDVTHILYGTDEVAVRNADEANENVRGQRGHTFLYIAARTNVLNPTERARIHEVHLCGLEPDTTYYYKVGGAGHWSDVFDMATAPPKGSVAPWSFAATGDARNNRENAWPITQRRIRDRAPNFQVFSGDAVFLGAFQPEWDGFFEASEGDFQVQDLFARLPIMMSNGNHDALATNYVAQFALPQEVSDSERAQGEEWYSFDYANAHFVVLNDTVADESVIGGAQADWLRDDLSKVDREQTPWVFAVHHRPFYTCLSTHRPDTSLRAAWQPIFDQFEVDIVLNGHNHVYERSNPIRGLESGQGVVSAAGANGVPLIQREGSGSGRPSGTLYIVAAGVGAPLYGVADTCPETHIARSIQNYAIVDINDRTLTFTVRNPMNDQIIDEFSYTK